MKFEETLNRNELIFLEDLIEENSRQENFLLEQLMNDRCFQLEQLTSNIYLRRHRSNSFRF